MFLTRLVLDNIRSIQHMDLSLRDIDGKPRKWTFILGDNGIGKSTVLRAVALGFAGSEALPELLGSPRDWVRWGHEEGRIHAEFTTAQGEERQLDLVLGANDTLRELYERNAEGLEQLDKALSHSNRNYFTVGYGVSRAPSEAGGMTKESSMFRHPRARNVATLFSTDASLISLESWVMDVDYRLEGGLELARSALDDLLPGVTFRDVDRGEGELIFDTPDGPVPYRLLSDGYRNVAAWSGDLLAQITDIFDDLTDPLSARGLLLIDEIGLHLHPTWQRKLVRFIGDRLPGFQVLSTTHSPLAVHQAGEGELFFLRREEENAPATLHAYEGAPRNLMLHQLLTSPIFGLTTLDSEPVEDMKTEYRDLRDSGSRTSAQEKRMVELSDELADLPDWSEGIEGNSEVTVLLEDIKQELRTQS